jgi:hypothetical protein
MSLRQAALVAGFGYLLNPVTFGEAYLLPKLVVPKDIDQTIQNIGANANLFAVAIFCYLACFIGDVVIAWALYVLLIPVNRSLSLLTAWFRLMYTAVALFAMMNLVTVFRLLSNPEYLQAFGAPQLHAQVNLLLHSFRYDWSMGLILFGIHLILLGYLIYRSGYIPWLLGPILVIDGLGWMVDGVQPYFFPDAKLGFIFVTFFGEVLLMFWLLIRGWKVQEPRQDS